MRAFTLSMVLSLGFLGLSFAAMRRRRLREQSALLWLSVSFAMVFLSATLPLHLLDRVARLVGIAYPPDLLLLLAVLFLFALVFHLSLTIDRLSAKQTSIAQEVGLAAAAAPPAARGDEGVRPAGEDPTAPGTSWA